jgi:hypothetical protein
MNASVSMTPTPQEDGFDDLLTMALPPLPPKPAPDLAEIKRAASVLIAKGSKRVIELRAFDTPEKTWSGYFSNLSLATAASGLSAREDVPNVYWTLQEIDPTLLARKKNAVEGWAITTTKDENVLRYLYLPFDFDACRKSKLSSSNEEKERALELASKVRAFLSEHGISTIFADSGNGYHLLAPIDMQVSRESTALVSNILAAAQEKFGTCRCGKDKVNCGKIAIDISISNPSRILKAYGTVARKGPHTAERPWRLSKILDVPENLEVVAEESLRTLLKDLGGEAAAGTATVAQPASDTWEGATPETMEALLAEKGIKHGPRIPYKDGFKWQLAECVFHAHHESPDSFVFLGRSGLHYFSCSHPTCPGHRGGKPGWKAFKEHVGGFDLGRFVPADAPVDAATPARAPITPPTGYQDVVLYETFANEVPELQEWLWEGHIPIGALTLYAGNPDVGKTLAALDLVARVTKGLDFPNGSANPFPPSDVILCEAEDSRNKTLTPRLMVAAEDEGADMPRVHSLRIKLKGTARTRMVQLDNDLDCLEKTIAEHPECRLLVVSPISAYLGPGIKAIDDGAIRAVLTPLQEMAERLDIAVVAVIHLNKSSDYDVIYRISGAMGFVAVPRASWLFATDMRDRQSANRYMMPIKGNLAEKQKSTIFQVDVSDKPVQVHDRRNSRMVETLHPRIFWGETTDIDPNDVMRESTGPRKADKLPEAMAWVASLFNDPQTGEYSSKPLSLRAYRKAWRCVNYPDQTIERAKRKLGVDYDRKKREFTMDAPGDSDGPTGDE